MNELLELFKDLTFEKYLEISDQITKFDESNIQEEMLKQASIYSYISAITSAYKSNVDKANRELTSYCAMKRKTVKENSVMLGSKLTAKDLDDAVESSGKYEEYSNAVIQAQEKYDMLRGLTKALDQKHSMLMQVSANKREEAKLYQKN